MKKSDRLCIQFSLYTIGVIVSLSSCFVEDKSLLVTTNIDEDFTHFYVGNNDKLYKYRLRRDRSSALDVAFDTKVVDEFGIGDNTEGSPVVLLSKEIRIGEWDDDNIQIYMAGSNGRVYRFIDNDADNNNFSMIWEFATGAPVTSSVFHLYKEQNVNLNSPINSFFYVGNTNGEFFCLDDNGTEQWKFATESGAAIHSTATGTVFVTPSAGIASLIFFGADDGYFYALNGETGLEQWKFYTEGSVRSSPLISPSNPVVIVGSDNGNVFALDQSGTLVWKCETGGSVRSSPAHSDNRIYIGSDDGKLYALNASSGQKLWEYQTGGPVKSTPYPLATGTKHIFIGSEDGFVYALSNDGTLVWKKDLEAGPITSSIVSDASRVYVNTPKGVFVLNFGNGDSIDHFGVVAGGTGMSSISIINYLYNADIQGHLKGEFSPNIHGTK